MEIWIIVGIVAVLAVVFVVIYNRLVRLRNGYRNAFSQIDVQMKRRHDLIPNLVETVKGYAKHERETLEAVIAARNQAEKIREKLAGAVGDAHTMAQLGQAEGMLGSVLGRLFALSEAYPDLKANENFQQLQEELTSTENRVAYARQFYNDTVLNYNNKIQSFPTLIFANMLKFDKREYFEADAKSREVPKLEF